MRGHPIGRTTAGWIPGLLILIAASLAGQTPFAMPGVLVLCGLALVHVSSLAVVHRLARLPDHGGLVAALPGALVIGLSPYLMLPEARLLAGLWLLYWLALHRDVLGQWQYGLVSLVGLGFWALVSFRDLDGGGLLWASELLLLGLAAAVLARSAPVSSGARAVASAAGKSAGMSLRDAIEADYVPRALEGGEIVEVLGREKARVDRRGDALSICLLAPDDFTGMVERLGRDGSDAVLDSCAERILSRVRQMDLVGRMQPGDEPLGRYGSHEFMVVLPATDIAGALQFARRMRRGLEEVPLQAGDGRRQRCSVSVGVASYRDGERIQDLVLRAEEALQRAQQLGGGRVSREAAGAA